MLPGCVTSVQKPSGPLAGLKLEKVEDLKEETGEGREADRAHEVGDTGRRPSRAVPKPQKGSKSRQSQRLAQVLLGKIPI
jgi:hypothetical protein